MNINDAIAELTRLRDEKPEAKLYVANSDGNPERVSAIDVDQDGDIIIHIG